jgi:hypothetical protein
VPSPANGSKGGPELIFWLVVGALFSVNAVVQWFISDHLAVKVLSTLTAVCYFIAAALVWRRARTRD